MKNEVIAMPCENNKLCGHFGKAPEFKIFFLDESKNIVDSKIIPMTTGCNGNGHGSGHGIIPDILAKEGVSTVIVGGIGQGAVNKLASLNINLLTVKGTVIFEKIIEKYLNNELTTEVASCSGHAH